MMSSLRTICVYCGSGPGTKPAFAAAAREFGKILAESGIELVYGGGSVGLMGELAKSALHHGGKVTGVIPEFLIEREHMLKQAHQIVTQDMHERKRIMFERSDAFVALPGGIGTLEELYEVWTWRQLGYHDKPVGILNSGGYYDGLLAFLAATVQQQFLSDWQMSLIQTGAEPVALLSSLVQAAGLAPAPRLEGI